MKKFWLILVGLIVLEKISCAQWGEIIDSVGDVGKYSSMRCPFILKFPVSLFISYYDATNGNLKYVKGRDPSHTTIETVDSEGNVGMYTSLALEATAIDSIYYPHISYYDSTAGDLKYARWGGTQWNIEKVDTAGDVGLYTSIELDTLNYPHVSYYDATNGNLKYAYWSGSQWNIENVDIVGDVGLYTSLELDNTLKPHISYYDATNGDLKRAKGFWSIEKIDTAGDVGQYSSMCFTYEGQEEIYYYDATNGDLKLNGTTIDSIGDVGMFVCAGNDGSFCSYYDKTNGDLKWRDFWSTIDTLGDVGGYTSCWWNGCFNFAYYDFINKDLKFYDFGLGSEEKTKEQTSSSLDVQPNIIFHKATILCKVENPYLASLALYNLSGRQVKKFDFSEEIFWRPEQNIPPGFYFLCLQTGKHRKITKVLLLK